MPMSREQYLQQQASARIYQERADSAFGPWGVRAAAPTLGEDVGAYRRKLAIQAKRLLPDGHQLRQVQVKRMPNDAFEVFEPQILRACRDSASRDDTVPFDAPLRRVPVRDANGHLEYRYYGQRSFVHDFTRAGRRVTGFRTDQGYVDGSGRPLR